ncbi:hypothetical protein N0B44_00220 [Roseibacterium beibuensis]|uniref:Uncharacterized protein n=1 Tax=[Roseibacterium] beibuensis TaxID=1193142 RepID=A0ABP9L2U5_9RHOB|nr:hypothetical protein [Roseibacterium beibuensis]MCS6621325.1 hypothetical protein [Roseibacterium beibuensis]
MSSVAIPKRLGHIWIGDRPAPEHWMQTWRDKHPDWDYVRYDNAYLTGRRWRNQALITEYFKRGRLEGVADLMRYEILFEQGGFIPGADFECLHPCDELFTRPITYTCFETYPKKGCRMTPYLASAPGTDTLTLTLDVLYDLYARAPETAQQPWISVGNLFLRNLLDTRRDWMTQLKIFEAYTFIPKHKDKPRYDGPGKVYAEHHWGTTLGRYGAAPRHSTHEETLAALVAALPQSNEVMQ